MNQNKPPFDDVRQYPSFPDNEGQQWIEENQVQHYQQENTQFQNQQYDQVQYEESFPEQQDRQFPWQQGGQFSGFPGFPGGQSPGTGYPGFPGGQSPGTGLPGFPGGQLPGTGFPGFPGGQSPGTGFPGQPGSQFPGHGPPFGGGGQSAGPPNTPPPSFTPAAPQFQTFAVDSGAIRGCLFRFTYIWLNRDQFWFFPTFVGRNSVAGFRWRRNRWVYFGIDLNRIQSFQCY